MTARSHCAHETSARVFGPTDGARPGELAPARRRRRRFFAADVPRRPCRRRTPKHTRVPDPVDRGAKGRCQPCMCRRVARRPVRKPRVGMEYPFVDFVPLHGQTSVPTYASRSFSAAFFSERDRAQGHRGYVFRARESGCRRSTSLPACFGCR